jgi:TPR repeat protein/serine/threonine protein kinase
MFTLNPEKINYEEELGKGASGSVYTYQKNANDDKWVVKHVFSRDVDDVLLRVHEIVLNSCCDHPNIVALKGYNIEKNVKPKGYNVYMRFPRMEGTLRDLFNKRSKSNSPFKEGEVVKYFYALTCGIEYLHSRKIAHRDVKPANVLFDKHGSIKLSDIGLGKHIADDETSYLTKDKAGTPLYAAPEINSSDQALKRKDLYKTDLWSLGVVIAELCLLQTKAVNLTLTGRDRELDLAKKLASLKEKYNPVIVDLISRLLRWNPAERIPIEEVRKILEENFENILGDAMKSAGNQNTNEKIAPSNNDALNDRKKEIDELKTLIENLEKENRRLNEKSGESNRKNETLTDRIEDLNLKIKTLEGENRRMNEKSGDSTRLNEALADKTREVDNLRTIKGQLEDENRRMNEKRQEVSKKNEALTDKIDDLKVIIKNLEDDNRRSGEKKGENSSKIEALTDRIDDLNIKIKSLEGENRRLSELADRKKEIDVNMYKKSAEQGDSAAQFTLGVIYHYGLSVSKNMESAVSWYRKAADQGDSTAQCMLGNMYYHGEGVPRIYEQASVWYRKAANQGNATAQYNLGNMYKNGHGVPKNSEQAVIWFKKASDQGYANAQFSLGDMYKTGEGVQRDIELALNLFQKAANQGHASAQNTLGSLLCLAKHFDVAAGLFRKAADQGHASAQYNLGMLYKSGDGVLKSGENAVYWFKKSAEQGDVDAQAALGDMYKEGDGVSQNYEQAAIWLRKAAEQGTMNAQFNLGILYYHGNGVMKNFEQAAIWFKRAADQGLATAQYNLGIMYKNGQGVSTNTEQAKFWFKKAADQGDEDAKNQLNALNNANTTFTQFYFIRLQSK